MTIEKYAVLRKDQSTGEIDHLYDDIDEARADAQERRAQLVAVIYEFSDTELVEDYSEDN